MLQIEDTEHGLRLRGEIDIAAADDLAQALARETEQGDEVELDMSGVTFLDSTGLAVVIRAAMAIEGRGVLVLRGAPSSVRPR